MIMRPVITTSGQSVIVSDTATCTAVASSATVVTLLAANADRVMATFTNNSTSSLFLRWGTGASLTTYSVPLAAQSYYELPLLAGGKPYTGIVTGIWTTANGTCNVTEAS